LITSSKYLTFNILREYWVACCVFFYRSYDFRTYFLKNPVHSVFSGRFSVFCRNRLTLIYTILNSLPLWCKKHLSNTKCTIFRNETTSLCCNNPSQNNIPKRYGYFRFFSHCHGKLSGTV
jgi:hypothetical protein